MVTRQQGEKFFKVAGWVMNKSSYLFRFTQPIRTKSSLQIPLARGLPKATSTPTAGSAPGANSAKQTKHRRGMKDTSKHTFTLAAATATQTSSWAMFPQVCSHHLITSPTIVPLGEVVWYSCRFGTLHKKVNCAGHTRAPSASPVTRPCKRPPVLLRK